MIRARATGVRFHEEQCNDKVCIMNLKDMSLIYQTAINKRVEAYKKNFDEFSEESFQLFRVPIILWFSLYKESVKIDSIPYRIAPITERSCFLWTMLYYLCLDLVPTIVPLAVALGRLPRSERDPVALGSVVMVAIDAALFFIYAAGRGGEWKHYKHYNFSNPYFYACLLILVVSSICFFKYHDQDAVVALNSAPLLVTQYFFAQYAPCRTVYLCKSSLPKPSRKWNRDLDKKRKELLKTAELTLKKNFVYLLYGQSEGNLVVYRLFESFSKNDIFSNLNMSIERYFGDQDYCSGDPPRKATWLSMLNWLKTKEYIKEEKGQQECHFSSDELLPNFIEKLRGELLIEENSTFENTLATEGCPAQEARAVDSTSTRFNPVWLFYFWDGKVPKDSWPKELEKEYDAPFINYQAEDIAAKEVDEVVHSLILDHRVQKLSCQICFSHLAKSLGLSLRGDNNARVAIDGDGNNDLEVGRAP